jgi:hypothetical protein
MIGGWRVVRLSQRKILPLQHLGASGRLMEKFPNQDLLFEIGPV